MAETPAPADDIDTLQANGSNYIQWRANVGPWLLDHGLYEYTQVPRQHIYTEQYLTIRDDYNINSKETRGSHLPDVIR